MDVFMHGPFIFTPGQRATINSEPTVDWAMSYSAQLIAQRRVAGDAKRPAIADEFSADRAAFIRAHRPSPAVPEDPLAHGYMLRLVRSTAVTGEAGSVIDEFLCLAPVPGMSGGMIDDRFPTWAVAGIGTCDPMEETEFARLKVANEAIKDALLVVRDVERGPRREWIARLLPEDILTFDAEQWRAPTAWEIRHVVGEGSFTGITGAEAAMLVGITPRNFRKYTARDDVRQNMSFAMWHLLLLRLGVQEISDENQP